MGWGDSPETLAHNQIRENPVFTCLPGRQVYKVTENHFIITRRGTEPPGTWLAPELAVPSLVGARELFHLTNSKTTVKTWL